MEQEQAEQLLDEVRQICVQYRAEVPGGRRAWPRSVRERVIRLRRSGMPWKSLAEATEIPVHTLYQWGSRRGKRAGFSQVALVSVEQSGSGTKSVSATKSREGATVTVAVGADIRLEGVDLYQAAEFVRLLRS